MIFMYKRHKRILFGLFVAVFFATLFFNLDFSPVAEAAITVASIAMGVYIAAVSAMLGSDYAKSLKATPDKEHPTKTLLGVLADYFRIGGFLCVALILTGCLYLIPTAWNISGRFAAKLIRCGSALAYALFSINILFLWLILVFLVNSLSKSIK